MAKPRLKRSSIVNDVSPSECERIKSNEVRLNLIIFRDLLKLPIYLIYNILELIYWHKNLI